MITSIPSKIKVVVVLKWFGIIMNRRPFSISFGTIPTRNPQIKFKKVLIYSEFVYRCKLNRVRINH